MAYQVLARKWRPKTFSEVVGQSTVSRTLQNSLASGRVGHAFLLSGARGVGKTTTARILAKALNCSATEGPNPEPCGTCASCEEITTGTSLDVQEIDGATNNGVEQVRELRESARYNPARDRYKIWIIDEVHMLSTGAFNALLKTLEEPPPRVKFIFATTEYRKIPDTILSRCQQFEFRMVPARELVQHLRHIADAEKIQVSDETLGRIARAGEGSVRDSLSLFDQVLAFSGDSVKDEDVTALLGLIDRELLKAAAQAIQDGDTLAVFQLVERLADVGADYRAFARELLLFARELLLLKCAPESSPLVAQMPLEERELLRPIAEAFSEEDLLRVLDTLTRLETDLRFSQDPRVTLELGLLKLARARHLVPLTDLVKRVEALAGGQPVPPPAPRPVPASRPLPPLPSPTRTAPPVPAAAAPPVVAVTPPAPAVTPMPAPAVTPMPAPAAAPAADGDVIAALQAAVANRPSLVQPLRGASAILTGDVLRLNVAPDFTAFMGLHADDYRELAKKALGRTVKVEFGTVEAAALEAAQQGGPAPDPAVLARAQEKDEKQRLMQEAAREPGVKEAIDLFGGTVVDVRQGRR